ncbi:hypothetical protein PIB30_105438 [Stylosanthes scabra]|uniref:Uncharacterized protein n=1 Tax=Stylosanthes scabra TaxID=79078 RepID=A0ABU6QYX3_9FABA|nr:hypothetical protein [Stylosanthes scabra]
MEELPSSNNIRKNHHKLMKPYWLFSLCSKLNTDAVIVHSDADAPSLDQVAAVQSPDSLDEEEEATREWEQSNNRLGVTIVFPCLCG